MPNTEAKLQPLGKRMPAVEQFGDEQTITFRAPAEWGRASASADELVHLLLHLPEEGGPPQRIPLRLFPLTIGRCAPADVLLEGGTVSRRHCRLELRDGQVLLSDLGSTNGTFVNGARVEGSVALQDGAALAIGAHRLRYQRRSRDETAEAEAIDRELRDAAEYVAATLPPPILEGPVQAEWVYQPSAKLGGDAFGFQWLDRQHFAAFVLDVAGHGAAAALHAVSVVNVLRQRLLPGVDFRDPAAVIRSLNRMFPMEQHNAMFFTIWYGVYDNVQRHLTFATGGHHAAYLLPPTPLQPVALATRNPSIGIVPDRDMAAARVGVPPGSALYMFSDGVFEIVDRDGRQWELEQVLALLPAASTPGGPQRLYETIRAAAQPGPLEDDFSAVVLRFA
jgi:serine phosphatase RsbU (regulator of sigma subunit)